ncbi:SMP-30/gluconolactonase/LRE family protein [Rhizobium sp. L1K21]|uniref:SMP-30/gluconolactonase/LRE family protein n=1 Tax=Rhizobium sp. L1K21 TaxID=2954933 RepID=UPI002092A7AE|nr:SMP-30/gluconolactonase/LRE family protein [Rhizobium sp. L1K21]MCO6186950.1 SMP-30/gluconolactonase/LRE family protein [Rhizobium sp. L1K21]
MIKTHEFKGRALCETGLELGEGPSYDPVRNTAFWFNIVHKELHELNLSSGEKQVHALPAMCSVLARIDDKRQAVVSEHGIYIRDVESGAMELAVAIEKDEAHMRSNDGRVHPSGALWFGTMTKTGDGREGAGSIYHVAGTKVTKLYSGISIPNGICFSPDGSTGYFVDTVENVLKKVALDPKTGLPAGAPQVFSDERQNPGGCDGSVCDADGNIWNARWGVGEVQVYDPSGIKTAAYKLPTSQTSCPAFIGPNADRLLVTSAKEDMSAEQLAAEPQAGFTFELGVAVNGRLEPDFKL